VGDPDPFQLGEDLGDVALQVVEDLPVLVAVEIIAERNGDVAAAHGDAVVRGEPVVVNEVARVFNARAAFPAD
jgi:hypothetical protein